MNDGQKYIRRNETGVVVQDREGSCRTLWWLDDFNMLAIYSRCVHDNGLQRANGVCLRASRGRI
jgi:hypothetical protein